jgi:hypothetical protein
MPNVRVPTVLREKLATKEISSQGALLKCLKQLAEDPRHSGLRSSKVQGTRGVFESRASRSDRVTWEWDEGVVVILNHCKHDETLKRPRG